MYKFGPVVSYNLNEAEQKNPLRWELLFREDDTFTPQTAVFKCKDYFNDIVGAYQGYYGIAYGMNTKGIKLNPDGAWIKLYNVNNTDGVFVNNINAVLQPELVESLGVSLTLEELDDKTFLMFIPRKVFDCTWYISLATYIIRLSNYGIGYASLDALIKAPRQESDHFTKLVAEHKFNLPPGLEKYWFYCGPTHNSLASKNISLVHNNGMCNLSNYYPHIQKELECAAS